MNDSDLGDEPRTDADVLSRCLGLLRARVPTSWTISNRLLPTEVAAVDGVIDIMEPDGARASFAAEIKRSMERRDVLPVVEQIRSYTADRQGTAPLLLARYLPPGVREALRGTGTSYIDATGNMRVELPKPALFISDRGEDRDPWRSRIGRPRGTLKGVPATRVVRAITDWDVESWSARELSDRAEVSVGATYRVLEYLQTEGLAVKGPDARYRVNDWRAVIESWSRDYGFLRSNAVTALVAPRGLNDVFERMAVDRSIRYSVSGSRAASYWSPYAPDRAAMVYVDDVETAMERWGLRVSKTASNVLLAQPESDVVYDRGVVEKGGLCLAAPAQVAVDLLSGPGRNPAEGDDLLRWMGRNTDAWRR